MESANKKVILIAILLSIVTTFLIYLYIRNLGGKPQVEDKINVFVATKTMPSKYVITENDIKEEKVSKDYLNENAVLNKAQIVGKRIKDRIIEGEQILKSRLVDSDGLTLAYNVPKGKRAVSINVDEKAAIAGLLRPGDFVDMLVNLTPKDPLPQFTKTVVQNVEVLAISQDQVIEGEKLEELPKTVTLAVSPSDVEKVSYSSEFGNVVLTLRPVGDDTITSNKGAAIESKVDKNKVTFKFAPIEP